VHVRHPYGSSLAAQALVEWSTNRPNSPTGFSARFEDNDGTAGLLEQLRGAQT
jgi:hypothetical protein